MAHSSSLNSEDPLASTEQISTEIDVPVQFEQSDTLECVVCVQQTCGNHDIYTSHTIASGTSIHTFLSKYSHNDLPFTSDVNKYICDTCLQLVNVLEHAEIQYVKLKCTFETIIGKNPLFRTPESIRLVCEKEEGTGQEGEYNDTSPYSGDDLDASATSVEVKVERNNEEEDINYGGLEDLVDTVMEPDPLDDDIRFPDDMNDGAAQELLLSSFQAEENPTNIPSSERPYECEICHRRFAHKYHLRDHEIIHTGEKPYQCKVCLRSYNRKGYLQSHIQRYHAGVKLFQCEHCPEQFSKISELRSHVKKYFGESFKCDICNCEFKRKDNYHRHLKTHSVEKERPFECPICQKRFVEKPHLRNHLATHSSEKPFVCTICQYWFNRKGNLKRHMRRHTGEKPYECEACQRRFSQKLHLQNHFRRKHTIKPVKKEDLKQKGSKKRKNSTKTVLKKSETVANGFEDKKEVSDIKS